MYYKLVGKEVIKVEGILEWALWFEDNDRRIKYDLYGGVMVSTIFTGISHAFIYGGDPVVFETMVFGGEFDQYQRQYTSYDEALLGHQEIIDMLNPNVEMDITLNNFILN